MKIDKCGRRDPNDRHRGQPWNPAGRLPLRSFLPDRGDSRAIKPDDTLV
jgi:hypothetical protein